MNRSKFIQGLNSNIELSDKERRRANGGICRTHTAG